MSILFINGSPNKNGNTAALAKKLLAGKEYKTISLSANCNEQIKARRKDSIG